METASDLYEILHVHPDAPVEIIRVSYRGMMQQLKLHPDLGGDHDQAILINMAYDTLRNETLRAAYDKERSVAFGPRMTRNAAPKATPKKALKRARKKPAAAPTRP